jgi:hypothetical protein
MKSGSHSSEEEMMQTEAGNQTAAFRPMSFGLRPPISAFCIDPANARSVWPDVSPLIYAAMKRGGLGSFAKVEQGVLAGELLLWVGGRTTDEEGQKRSLSSVLRPLSSVLCAAVTALEQTEWHKACAIVACGGRDAADWIGLLSRIEEFARAEGCGSVRIYGREGWLRLLPVPYRVKRVVIERMI